MTLNSKTFLIVAAVLVLVAGYFYTTVDWEARAIRKRIDQMVEQVEKKGPVSTFEALGRSRKLVDVFLEGAEVEYVPGRRLPKNLDSMGAAFISAWGQVEKASVTVTRHEVTIDPERPEAESMLTARCSVIFGGAERMGDTLEYKIFWQKVDGEWYIRSLFPVS